MFTFSQFLKADGFFFCVFLQLCVSVAFLKERSSVSWMRCKATWTAWMSPLPWTWSHQWGAAPPAQMIATQKRPLGPSPEPTTTSLRAAAASARDQPAQPTSAQTKTTTQILFLRMAILPKSHVIPLLLMITALLPVQAHAPLPLRTTNQWVRMWTTTTIRIQRQHIRIMARPTTWYIKGEVP